MSLPYIIAISPSGKFNEEPAMINALFDAGLYRYHIKKNEATEQAIAELLEAVEPKFLNQITLHSHFHLVLAYGVGGIHYSLAHRTTLGDDYVSKVKLYQSFGVKVSADVKGLACYPADYALSSDPSNQQVVNDLIFTPIDNIQPIGKKPSFFRLDKILKNIPIQSIVDAVAGNK